MANDFVEVHGTLKRSIGVDIRAHFNDDVGDDGNEVTLEVWIDVLPDWANDTIAEGFKTFVFDPKKTLEDYENEVRQAVELRQKEALKSREIVDDDPEIEFPEEYLNNFIKETAQAIVDNFAEYMQEVKDNA